MSGVEMAASYSMVWRLRAVGRGRYPRRMGTVTAGGCCCCCRVVGASGIRAGVRRCRLLVWSGVWVVAGSTAVENARFWAWEYSGSRRLVWE